MLFSTRSLLTMLHGLVLSGGAIMAIAAALFALRAMALPEGAPVSERQGNNFAWVAVAAAVLLWLAVLGGTYIVFPPYRATPPEGLLDLTGYPRAILLADPSKRWLHTFAMEIKEHMPWIAAMLTTAAAFVAHRYRSSLLAEGSLRRATGWMLSISMVLVLCVALLGVFVNKIAPLE